MFDKCTDYKIVKCLSQRLKDSSVYYDFDSVEVTFFKYKITENHEMKACVTFPHLETLGSCFKQRNFLGIEISMLLLLWLFHLWEQEISSWEFKHFVNCLTAFVCN